MSLTGGDPFEQTRQQLLEAVYPSPTPGFATRLNVLLALQGYYVFATLVFFVLYGISQRRQGNSLWVFRMVRKPEGKYLIPNVYVVSTTPALAAAALLTGLIENCRRIYIDKDSQAHAFYWRNLVWLLVWLHGWTASYSILQAVLITSTAPAPTWAPPVVNTGYIAGAIVCLTAITVPAVMSAMTWKGAMQTFYSAIDLSNQGSATLQRTGSVDFALLQQIQQAVHAMLAQLTIFDRQWLAQLIIWVIASFVMLLMCFSGVALIHRLRKQVKFSEASQHAGLDDGLVSVHVTLDEARMPSDHENEKLPGAPIEHRKSSLLAGLRRAGRGGTRSAGAQDDRARAGINSHHHFSDAAASREASIEAMRRLTRDVTVQCAGISLVTLIFVATIILLAVKRKDAYSVWAVAEIGMTLPIWAYSVGLSGIMTLIAFNQAVWLWKTRPSRNFVVRTTISNAGPASSLVGQGSGIAARRAREMTAVQVTTLREVEFEDHQSPQSDIFDKDEIASRSMTDKEVSQSSQSRHDERSTDTGQQDSALSTDPTVRSGRLPDVSNEAVAQQFRNRNSSPNHCPDVMLRSKVRLAGERSRDKLYPDINERSSIAPFE